jgi:DNA-binding transcriptional LysR family regulator
MDLRELKAFTVVARELNFRKAAEVLGMTQSPLSRLIANLEHSLGVKLLTRSTRAVELTGEGVHLLNRALKILQETEALEKELKSLNKRTTIRISLHHAAIHSHFPKLVSSFKEQFPKIEIELDEIPSSQVERKLLDGDLDVSIGLQKSDEPELESMAVDVHELGLLIPAKHSLAKKKQVKLTELSGETLIFHGKGDQLGFQADFHKFLRRKNIPVNIYFKKAGESCPNLVVLGKGLLITSRSLVPFSENAQFASFANFSPKMKVFALWRVKNLNPDLKAFISFLEQNKRVPKSEMDSHLV